MVGIMWLRVQFTWTVFSLVSLRSSSNCRLLSIRNPRYLRNVCEKISQFLMVRVVVSLTCLLVTRTTSVSWSIGYRPTEESHLQIVARALFDKHVISSKFLLIVTKTMLSAKPLLLTLVSIGHLSTWSHHLPQQRPKNCQIRNNFNFQRCQCSFSGDKKLYLVPAHTVHYIYYMNLTIEQKIDISLGLG